MAEGIRRPAAVKTPLSPTDVYLVDCGRIKRDSFLSPSYEPDGYAELPKYEWNAEFTAEGYAATIVEYNDYLYRQMKEQQVPIDFDRPALPTHAFEGSPSSLRASPL